MSANPGTTTRAAGAMDALARRETIKRRVWMACIWSWPVCIIGAGLAFALGARFIPPPSPARSAPQLAGYFAAHHTGIRVGVLVAMFATALMLPYLTVVSAEIKKIEGRLGLLVPIQFGGAVVLVMIFQIIGLAWLSSSYRPEAAPDVVRALNDYTWFPWRTFIATYSIQYLCMAIAGFMDILERPIWPRWAAYMTPVGRHHRRRRGARHLLQDRTLRLEWNHRLLDPGHRLRRRHGASPAR